MSTTETCYQHITFDSKGIPIIVGTNTKVIELVVERIAYGWSPEELHLQHQYLSLGQVFAALAFFEDNRNELLKEIERRLEKVENLRCKNDQSSIIEKLKMRTTA